MRKGTKTGLLLVAIAILYFIWILVVTFHEAGYLLEDTDFIFSLMTWAAIGIALYLCIIIILLLNIFYSVPTKKSPLDFFKKMRGKKKQIACSNCKNIFTYTDTGERPMDIVCPNCKKRGVIKGKKVTATKQTITCRHCANTFEIFDQDKKSLKYECPQCHTVDKLTKKNKK